MLISYLCRIFNSILVHGCTNLVFNSTVTVPLIKNKRKAHSDSNNYRALALSSVMCKLFEYVLLEMAGQNLMSSDFQFAYKLRHSTTQF